MSVLNVLDGSLPIDSSQVIHDITLTYTNSTGSATVNVPSTYVCSGSGNICMLWLPYVGTFAVGNGNTFTITIPNEIIPTQTITFYGFRYSLANNSIVLRLTAGSNIIAATNMDSNTLAEGGFTLSGINIFEQYITYQIN